MMSVIALSAVIKLSTIMMFIALHCIGCSYAGCHAERYSADWLLDHINAIALNAVMLSVVISSVAMLAVAVPKCCYFVVLF
jgi:hypothetical protein